MALTYEIDKQVERARITGTRKVTMSSMIDVVQQVADDPGFSSHFTVIFDLREAEYTAELSDGDALAAVLRQKTDRFLNRFAVVVPESLHFLARLYCALTGLAGFDKIKCFTDMAEAERWCGSPPST